MKVTFRFILCFSVDHFPNDFPTRVSSFSRLFLRKQTGAIRQVSTETEISKEHYPRPKELSGKFAEQKIVEKLSRVKRVAGKKEF